MSFVGMSLLIVHMKIIRIDEETCQWASSGFFEWDSNLFKHMTALCIVIAPSIGPASAWPARPPATPMQTRFVGITYHIYYTSLYLFVSIQYHAPVDRCQLQCGKSPVVGYLWLSMEVWLYYFTLLVGEIHGSQYWLSDYWLVYFCMCPIANKKASIEM